MNILIISRYPPFPGGRENFVLELVNQFSKNNNVLVLTPDVDFIENDNLIIKRYPESKKDLEEIIKEFNPDIVNSHTFYLSKDALEISKKLDIPFGITLHGDQFAIGDEQRQGIVSEISKNADFVINVSDNGRQSLIKNVYGLNKDKVSVIKNGVNLERFSKDTDSGPLFRNTLGINSDTFVVITPTRIASYKGLDFLIDMVSLGKKFFTDEKVLFLVSVPDYLLSEEEMELFDNFKNKVERLEVDRIIKFTFTKYEEVNNLYNCSDAFLLPSENEQFPMAILEAMASEVPVISTNVGGIPELLITDEDALLVDFGDIISLYKAVETLILKKDNLLSKIAFDKVKRFYSISDIAEKYITTYEKYTPSTK